MKTHLIFWLIGVCGLSLNLQAQNPTEGTTWQGKPLPKAVNSDYDELQALPSPDGKGLYFLRAASPQNEGGAQAGLDIWYSERQDTTWTEAKNLGATVNNRLNNTLIGILPTGDWLLSNTYGPTDEGKWLVRQKADGGSSTPVALTGLPRVVRRHLGMRLSASGKYLLISTLATDSTQQEDLYIAASDSNGGWKKPFSLGKTINTAGMEIAPFLTQGDSVLYFATNGRPGLGGFDIYRSRRLDSTFRKWSAPENLGSGINTPGFDSDFVVDAQGKFAYYTSGPNPDALGDIYWVDLQPAPPKRDTVAPVAELVSTPPVSAPVIAEVKPMAVAPQAGKAIQFFILRFATNKTVPLNKDVLAELKAAVPEAAEIEIEGHADSKGSDAYNLKLSQRRAEAIRKEIAPLLPEGVEIKIRALGEKSPLNMQVENLDSDAANRRVWVFIRPR